jgi:hypothetical protein
MGSKKASLRDEPLHAMKIYQDDWKLIYQELINRANISKPYGVFADIIHDWLLELEGLREEQMKERFRE